MGWTCEIQLRGPYCLAPSVWSAPVRMEAAGVSWLALHHGSFALEERDQSAAAVSSWHQRK